MTPAARVSAAIELLDTILDGASAERCLTTWARGNRYAGSKDRRAIRDYVFDALRCLRSCAWLGGAGEAPTGRSVMIGLVRAQDIDPASLFTGEGYGPEALTEDEAQATDLAAAPRGVQHDCPDWLLPHFDSALGDKSDAALDLIRARSAVFLRVNRAKATIGHAIEMLAEDSITAIPHALSETALEATVGARGVARSQAYLTGVVELQDAGSQAVIDLLPVDDGQTVLDYCAGGGGKSLAIAAKAKANITAHDIDQARMQDIVPRAARAGAEIKIAKKSELAATYDVVLIDVPCSGSGSWSRAPQAKWLLNQSRLDELTVTQAGILDEVASRVADGGLLAYVTCSLFESENQNQITAFLERHSGFVRENERHLSPLDGADGFYLCLLRKAR